MSVEIKNTDMSELEKYLKIKSVQESCITLDQLINATNWGLKILRKEFWIISIGNNFNELGSELVNYEL
jgi:hypothetical protein